jgi:hypothetical protein
MIQFIVRPALPKDAIVLFDLIKALAEYEKLTHEVKGGSN